MRRAYLARVDAGILPERAAIERQLRTADLPQVPPAEGLDAVCR